MGITRMVQSINREGNKILKNIHNKGIFSHFKIRYDEKNRQLVLIMCSNVHGVKGQIPVKRYDLSEQFDEKYNY